MQVVGSADKRKKMVNSIHSFVTNHKFDGFDIDWEYPAARGGAKADKSNYIQFLKELRAKFGKNLLITGAVGATKSQIDISYDVANMNK